MEVWKTAVTKTEAELIGKGFTQARAHKIALKRCKALHPSHRQAVARRVEMADLATEMSGIAHNL